MEHFDIIKTDKKSKGRPKKIISNLETKAVDLFSKLSDDTEFNIIEDDEEVKEVKEVKVVKAKLTDEEKEIKKAQLEEERAKKKAEREQKLAQEKAQKKEAEQTAKALEKEKEKVKECDNFEAPQQTTKVSVSKIQILGKKYLKSSVNILYDPDTKEEIGIWDPETNTIKDLPEDDDEEEEDSYDTDDDN